MILHKNENKIKMFERKTNSLGYLEFILFSPSIWLCEVPVWEQKTGTSKENFDSYYIKLFNSIIPKQTNYLSSRKFNCRINKNENEETLLDSRRILYLCELWIVYLK